MGRRKLIVPEYTGLGQRLLPPAVAAGDRVVPETEAQAWALFALDLLALGRSPSPLSGVADLAAFAMEAPADAFKVPETVAWFGRALTDGSLARALLEKLSHLGEDPPRP